LRTLEADGDFLACECGRRYPIVDGVPIVVADPSAQMREQIAAVVERDLAPEVAAALAASGPDDAPYPRLLEHVSIYMDAHWIATPPLVAKLATLPRVGRAVELGCSAGRAVAELCGRA